MPDETQVPEQTVHERIRLTLLGIDQSFNDLAFSLGCNNAEKPGKEIEDVTSGA